MDKEERRTPPEKKPVRDPDAPKRRPRSTAGKQQAARQVQPKKAGERVRRSGTRPAAHTKEKPAHGKLYEVLDAQTEAPAAAPVRNPVLRDAVCGVILAALACIGVWTVVRQCSIRIRQKQAADPAREQIEACILPLVLIDANSFSAPDEMSDEAFLTAAIWAFITDGGLADYPTETDLCTVPEKVITAAGNARFGTSRTPAYQTIGFTERIRFYYDAEQKAYLLPADPKYFGYLPEIASYSEEAGIYTVEADYHPEQPAWYRTEAPTVRHAVFTLKHSGDAWQILSFDNGEPEKEETASAKDSE